MFRRRCRQSALLLLLLAQQASPTGTHAPPPFNLPQSPALDHVNLFVTFRVYDDLEVLKMMLVS